MVALNLQKLFDPYFYNTVENISYDYKSSIIELFLKEPDNEIYHRLVFRGVTSLMWTMCGFDGKICQNIFPELSSIIVSTIQVTTDNKWLKSYPLHFNIAIEIMDRALLICANAVEVDGILNFLTNCDDVLSINNNN